MTTIMIVLNLLQVAGLVAIGILLLSLRSYSQEKGKNQATKEDITDITNKIEQVRLQYSQQMEELSHQNRVSLEQNKFINQLRLSALEKRFEAHQQAYTLWRNLVSCVHQEDKIHGAVIECQEWWEKNCLYLESEVRRAFYISYMNAPLQRDFLLARDLNGVKANWKDITRTGELIMKTFDLLSISGIEKEIPVPEIENEVPNQGVVSDAANDAVPHTP